MNKLDAPVVWGNPPPKPENYPATIEFMDWYGKKEVTVNNEEEYHAVVFWYWQCAPSF